LQRAFVDAMQSTGREKTHMRFWGAKNVAATRLALRILTSLANATGFEFTAAIASVLKRNRP
jgi:hypothetical protein